MQKEAVTNVLSFPNISSWGFHFHPLFIFLQDDLFSGTYGGGGRKLAFVCHHTEYEKHFNYFVHCLLGVKLLYELGVIQSIINSITDVIFPLFLA